MTTSPRKTETVAAGEGGYHHGDLPVALRAATADLVAERGPTGFSLREVARRAGVSHAAPAHHFGDSRGLLTSVAIEGFERLDRAFTEAADSAADPVARLTALGKAYVGVARGWPGHFAVMWADGLVDVDHPDFQAVATRTHDHLVRCITEIAAAHNPELDIAAAATLTWSSVHGLAMLTCTMTAMDKPEMRPTDDLDGTIEQFSQLLMGGFASR